MNFSIALYDARRDVLWNMINGMFYPGLENGKGPDCLNTFRPSDIQHLQTYIQARRRVCENLPQQPYLTQPSLASAGTAEIQLPEPLLLPPWNRISKVYDLMMRHEVRLLLYECAPLLTPDNGSPNRFVVLQWYDHQVARLRDCQKELYRGLGHDPDEQRPEDWFSSIDKSSPGKLPVFVFYNLRNLLLALLHEVEQQWPESFEQEPAYTFDLLFYEVLDSGPPEYEVLSPPEYPPCTRSYCDHKRVRFKDALIEIGLRFEGQQGKERHEEFIKMLEEAKLPWIDLGRGKRFIRRCELETLKQNHLKKTLNS